ncbi:MAG TPA: hypothetical protein VGJ91_20490 [Polyangiaceae bacterium]|jgi:hypothetical protein
MVEVRLSRLCTALAFVLVCVSLLVASCSTPEFKFVDSSTAPPHCQNELQDEGESDLNCGGACPPCALTQHCNASADCRDADCIDGICQAPGCNDGNQTDQETDVDCGGGACKTCAVGRGCHVGSDCQTGVCGDQGCAEATCGDRVTNGSETDIDCGGPMCPSCVAGQICLTPSDCVGNDCNAGRCALSCAAGLGNCDGDPSNACETNLRTDDDHCGDCATSCSLPNANASCAGGVCRVESCVAPFDDCNGDPADGCEVNTKTDVENCGACAAKPCPTVNGEAYCADSVCGITCAENFSDCDGEPGNGCEKDVSRDISNCGGCGKTCTASAGKTAWCRKGQCGETTCAAGRGDCNGDPDDDATHGGCETDLKTDVDSCGACGTICRVNGGEPQCSAGVCSVKSCSTGFDDCTGGYADGCETKTTTDLSNCGACGKTCSTANGAPSCVSGACQVKTCTAPFADCNGTASDGCETNTSTSQTHCGVCTGASANCDTAFANAGGQCTNSVCVLKTCATNFDNCDGVASNGCESSLKTDSNNCGACKAACSTAGATGTSCVSGSCVPKCSGKLLACGNPQNGCLIDGASDENNCGGCGKVCDGTSAAHVDSGGNPCLSSVCSPSCQKGVWDDCDNLPGNGCERSVSTDPLNCGGCDVTCGTANVVGSPTCGGGKCTSTCQPNMAKCGAPEAGCDTTLGTVTDCTKCGEACTGATTLCSPGVGCVAHFDIGVVGSSVSAKAGFESSTIPILTANHTLTNSKASGRNRIVLVGVTAIAPYLSGEFAWYNGTLMHSAVEVSSGGASYAGIFYLLDNELPPTPGSYQVKVQFSSGNNNGTGAFTATELQNVQQPTGNFVTTTANASADTNCSANPATRGVTLTFTQPGSFGYAVIAARAATTAMATPGALVETMNLLQNQPTPLTGVAGYAGPINGTSTLSWKVATCSSAAGVGVVLKRVGD